MNFYEFNELDLMTVFIKSSAAGSPGGETQYRL